MNAFEVISKRLGRLIVACIGLFAVERVNAQVIYVDADATGPVHDGTSWCTAFLGLAPAINAATPGTVIRVAGGVYRPAASGLPNPRTATFSLRSGVEFRGGYAGCGAANPDERSIHGHQTTLSGDLGVNDAPGFINRDDNAYHVLRGDLATPATILDGFTIIGGNADDTGPAASGVGAGMLSELAGSPTILNCTFIDNHASFAGGGIRNAFGSSPLVINTRFLGNTSTYGAAVANYSNSSPVFAGCLFSGNVAAINGGAMDNNAACSPTLTNCTVAHNEASDGRAGGVWNVEACDAVLVNCILWGNVDSSGNSAAAQVAVETGAMLPSQPVVEYSIIEGGWFGLGGTGNIAADPKFADITGLDGIIGTADDNALLANDSPGTDAGNSAAIPQDQHDLDGDADTTEPLPQDLRQALRFFNAPNVPDTGSGPAPYIDLGVYELQGLVDLDANGSVGLSDWALVVGCITGPSIPTTNPDCFRISIDSDLDIDLYDLADFQRRFSPGNNPPVLASIGNRTVVVGTTLTILLDAADPELDELSFVAQPIPLQANMALNAQTGVYTFAPADDQLGPHATTFIVSDGSLTDSETIAITVELPPPDGITAFSGRVLDAQDASTGTSTPLAGAMIRFLGTEFVTTSGDDGYFTLAGIPPGQHVFEYDGSTAVGTPGVMYGSYRNTKNIIEHVNNVVERPFYLPRIDPAGMAVVDPNNTTVVTNPNIGVTLTMPPHTVRTDIGTDYDGVISLSEVPPGFTPGSLPATAGPGLVITIQPMGLTFVQPAPVTFPNNEGFNPGEQFNIWSLDHGTGQFIIAGRAAVSADGQSIATILGGINESSWHYPLSSDEVSTEEDSLIDPCEVAIGSRAVAATGGLIQEHDLVGYRSLNSTFGFRLRYNSLLADPQPIIKARIGVPDTAPRPRSVSTSLAVGGVGFGVVAVTDTANIAPAGHDQIIQSLQFDGAQFPTGIYPITATARAHYFASSSAGERMSTAIVDNRCDSSFGAGWSLVGLDRIYDTAGEFLLLTGSGESKRFRRAPLGGQSFAPSTSFPFALTPVSQTIDAQAADINGDNHLDLVVLISRSASETNQHIAVFFGDGGGVLTFAYAISEPNGSPNCVLHDFNGDGFLDLLAGPRLRLGNGSGSFSPPVPILADAAVVDDGFARLAVSDVTNDGVDDVIYMFYTTTTGRAAIVVPGDGAGWFLSTATQSQFPGWSLDNRLPMPADFDEDGNLDLAIVGGPPTPSLSDVGFAIALGNGLGGFVAGDATIIATQGGLSGALTGDFNEDGHADILVSRSMGSSVMPTVLCLGDGTGEMQPPTTVIPDGQGAALHSLADFNYDGHLDLVLNDTTFLGTPDGVRIALGNGIGGFSAPVNIGPNPSARGVVVADFNHDDILDVVVARTNLVWQRLGTVESLITPFASPAGDFSTMQQNADGTFTRTMKNGAYHHFDDRGFQTSVSDRNGNTTDYGYDTFDRLERITDPNLRETIFGYSGGKLTSVTDPVGRVTQFEHDDQGNLTAIIDPDQTRREFSYDSRHRIIGKRSKRSAPTAYQYNFAGRVSRADRPDGSPGLLQPSQTYGLNPATGFGSFQAPAPIVRPEDVVAVFQNGSLDTTRLKLNKFGSLTSITDALNRRTTIVRDSNNNPIQRFSPTNIRTDTIYDVRGNALELHEAVSLLEARTSKYEYDPTFNLVTKIIDPAENTTTINRDPQNGNALSIVGPAPFSFTASRTYYPNGLLHTSTDENHHTYTYQIDQYGNLAMLTDPLGNVTSYVRDDAGNVLSITEGVGTSAERTSHYTYNTMNRLTSYTDGEGGTVSFVYDEEGNLTETHSPTGEVLRRFYDPLNRLIRTEHPIQGVSTFKYDSHGNLMDQTDARLHTTQFEYDAANQLKKIIDALGGETSYTYDLEGNATSVTDARGQAMHFEYDPLDRRSEMRNPLNQVTEYLYDSRDNLIEQHNPNGHILFNDYDSLNRLVQIETPDNVVAYTYDGVGNILTVTDDDTALRYTYDALDRVKTAETLPAGVQPVVALTYNYDAVGNRNLVTDSLGGSTGYDFDDAGRMTGVTAFGSTLSLGYDPAGRPTAIERPNGVNTMYGYYPSGRLQSLRHTHNDQDLFAFTYTHNAIGHIETIQRLDGTDSFVYDALNRLTDATKNGEVEFYRYDPVGNRTQSHLSAFHVHDAANRLLEVDSFTYTYDTNGNLTSKTDGSTDETMDYSYDAQGRLIRIDFPDGTFASYRYDGFGRRVEKNVNGDVVRYVYATDSIAIEFDGMGTAVARYAHGPEVDQPLLLNRPGGVYHYHADHLGSIVGLTDSASTTASAYAYDSFGQVTVGQQGTTNPFAFTAREQDDESGLHYYRARLYDSGVGRFLAEDALSFAGPLPGIINHNYAYVNGNPVNFSDPLGEESSSTGKQPLLEFLDLNELFNDLNIYLDATVGPRIEQRFPTLNFGLSDPTGMGLEIAKITYRESEHVRKELGGALSGTHRGKRPTVPSDASGYGGGISMSLICGSDAIQRCANCVIDNDCSQSCESDCFFAEACLRVIRSRVPNPP